MKTKEYWDALNKDLTEFDSKPFIEHSSQEDLEAFNLAHATLEALLKLGYKSEWKIHKHSCVTKAQFLNEQSYGKTGGAPEVKGPLSYDFASKVYLKHLERFASVEFDWLTVQVAEAKGTSIDKKKEETAEKAVKLKVRMDQYSSEKLKALGLGADFVCILPKPPRNALFAGGSEQKEEPEKRPDTPRPKASFGN